MDGIKSILPWFACVVETVLTNELETWMNGSNASLATNERLNYINIIFTLTFGLPFLHLATFERWHEVIQCLRDI